MCVLHSIAGVWLILYLLVEAVTVYMGSLILIGPTLDDVIRPSDQTEKKKRRLSSVSKRRHTLFPFVVTGVFRFKMSLCYRVLPLP